MQFDKFAKRILVMEVMNGKYVNKIEFEFINESMQQIDGPFCVEITILNQGWSGEDLSFA
jgi:hypothetical protein